MIELKLNLMDDSRVLTIIHRIYLWQVAWALSNTIAFRSNQPKYNIVDEYETSNTNVNSVHAHAKKNENEMENSIECMKKRWSERMR